MKKLFLATFLFIVTLISCQKEISFETNATGGNSGNNNNGNNNGGTNTSLLGTWKFNGIQASTRVEMEADLGGMLMKTITISSYNTKQNTGTYTLTSDKFTGTDVGYSIDTIMKAYTYMDGILQDSIEAPMQMPMTIQSSSSSYKLIGADSIYFTNGSMTINAGTGSQGMDAQPSGMKYKIIGNNLTFTFGYSKDTTIVQNATNIKMKQRVTGSVKLSK